MYDYSNEWVKRNITVLVADLDFVINTLLETGRKDQQISPELGDTLQNTLSAVSEGLYQITQGTQQKETP